MTVTEYDAKKNHTIKSQGKPGFIPSDWPRRIGDSLSDMVNYRHNRLEISVFTKLYEILDCDGSYTCPTPERQKQQFYFVTISG
jgi:hypothetical protein